MRTDSEIPRKIGGILGEIVPVVFLCRVGPVGSLPRDPGLKFEEAENCRRTRFQFRARNPIPKLTRFGDSRCYL
jgi:hypothetical protein